MWLNREYIYIILVLCYEKKRGGKVIKFKNVIKCYGKYVVVDNISFNINEGEFFVLIGFLGCGKIMILKMINWFIYLSEGYIYFKDKLISDYLVYEMCWDIGYVL